MSSWNYVAMPWRAFFVLELGLKVFGFPLLKTVAMPWRAFFVLEHLRQSGAMEEDAESQCPGGHFLFWNYHQIHRHMHWEFVVVAMPWRAFFVLERTWAGPSLLLPLRRRNALAGIFCFGTQIYAPLPYKEDSVAMPWRAFFVLEQLKVTREPISNKLLVAMPWRAFFVLEHVVSAH